MKIWALRIIGFILGALAVLAIEGIILYSFNLSPRGLGWIIIPILAGVGASNIISELYLSENSPIKNMETKFWLTSSANRFLIISPVFWVLIVGVFVWLFEPYGSYMSSSEYSYMYKIMFFPPCLLVSCYFIYSKLVKAKSEL